MNKAVIIYSGGMDSYTLLHWALEHEMLPYALTFDYGQKHRKEILYAKAECERIGIEHKLVDLSGITELINNSSLTSDAKVPEGHYEEDSMKQTVVPNRNMIMLSIAAAYAENIGADKLLIGAHSGDHAIYPDCRPGFIYNLNRTLHIGMYNPPDLMAPFVNLTKGGIAKIGKELALDYSKTWTCYNGREKHCGKCGACQERKEAMSFASIIDPTEYEE